MSINSVDLVIIYYNNVNSLDFTKKHIDDVSKLFTNIYLIDNGSMDGTFDKLTLIHSNKSNIKIIKIINNLHYGGALKHAMNISVSNYICWSQGDTVVDIDFYKKAIEKISKGNQEIFIKARRINRSVLETAITFSLSIYASYRLKKILYDISAFPTMVSSNLKNDIIVNGGNDYTVELYIYWVSLIRNYDFYRIPVAYSTHVNNQSSWSRNFNGYIKMIKNWNSSIERILKNEK
jgi:hypothetical protein